MPGHKAGHCAPLDGASRSCGLAQSKEWEARKTELTQLTSQHAELVALYEADLARLTEQETGAQAARDELAAHRAQAERHAKEHSEVRPAA